MKILELTAKETNDQLHPPSSHNHVRVPYIYYLENIEPGVKEYASYDPICVKL